MEYHSARRENTSGPITQHNENVIWQSCSDQYFENITELLYKSNGDPAGVQPWEWAWGSRARPENKCFLCALPPSRQTRCFGSALERALALLFLSDISKRAKRVLHERVCFLAGGERRHGITAWVHRCRQTEAVYCSSRINAKCILSPFDVVICPSTSPHTTPHRSNDNLPELHRDVFADTYAEQHRYVADAFNLKRRR